MAADASVVIDFDVKMQQLESDRDQINKILSAIGENTGDKMDDEFKKSADKVVSEAKNVKKDVDAELKKPTATITPKVDDSEAQKGTQKIITSLRKIPKDQKVKLDADAKKAGIDDFTNLLKRVPKKTRTEILAQAQKGEVIDYETLLNKLPKKVLTEVQLNDNASDKLRTIKKESENTKNGFTRLKTIVAGSFLGGAALSGVSILVDGLKNVAVEGANASDAMDKFRSTMKLGGFGEAEIKKASDQVMDYANKTVYDLDDISNTTAQLAANGVKNYMGLTEAAGNLNAQAGGNAETFKSVAMMLTQTAGAGKLTTENWNQLADAIPGASGVLQKAMKDAGAYTGNFRDAMANGQITAEEFSDALMKLGQTDGAKKAAESTKTFQGAIGNLKAAVTDGMKNVIDAFGKDRITGPINGFSGAVQEAFGKVTKTIEKNKKVIDNVGAVFSNVFKIVGVVGKAAFDTVKDAISGSIKAFDWVMEKVNKLVPGMSKLGKSTSSVTKHEKALRAVGVAIGTIVTALITFKTAQKAVAGVSSAIKTLSNVTKIASGVQKAFNIILSANPIGLVIVAIGALVIGIHEAYKHFKPFREMVDNTWGSLKKFGKIVSDVSGHVVKEFKKLGAELGKKWNSITKTASDKWSDLKDTIIDKSNKAYDASNKKFNSLKKTLSGTWSDTRNIASDKWESLRSTISSISESTRKNASGKFGRLRDSMGSILRSINNNWHSVWNNMAGFFDGIWNRIKGSAKSGLNHVIDFVNGGIGGINGVVHFFGGKKQSISPIKKLAKGGRIINSMTALVNDEEGSIYREAIFRNNGAIEVPNERNVITQLNPGDAVMPAKETAKFLGLPMYKSGFGDWIGKAANFVGDVTGDIGDWLADKIDQLEDALKDPLSILMRLFKKSKNNAEAVWHDIGEGAGEYVPKQAVDWFRKTLEGFKKKFDESGGSNPPGEGTQRWEPYVKKALAANGLPTSAAYVQAWLRQIQSESGGNPKAVQGGYVDINTLTGDLAKGLLQTISATFNAYKFPGHGNIFNGYDNMLAAIHYAKARYGSDMLAVIGHGHGYANGGHVYNKQLAWIAEDGDEFVINSRRDNADNLLLNAIAQRASVAPNSPSARLAKMVDQTRFSSVNGYGIAVPSVTGQQSQALTLTDNDNIDYTSQLKSIGSKLDDIMQKKVFIDGSSFSKSYERYGAVERTRRNTMMERGMSIDSRI